MAEPKRVRRLRLTGFGEQVQQIPLGHHRDVGVRLAQPAEVHHRQRLVAHGEFGVIDLALRQCGEALPQTELVEKPEGRGMHCVAAEVAQEVGVLLQHGDLDAGSGQQQSEHHAGGAAADYRHRRGVGHAHTVITNLRPWS